jgi:hypothetical protein
MNPKPAEEVKKETRVQKRVGSMAVALFAVSFVFAFALVAQPASAVAINLTVISDVINAFTGIISPITDLLIAIVPLWFIMQILAFIMGLLAAILGMIKFGKMSH